MAVVWKQSCLGGKNMKNVGVYEIRNTKNGRRYIGSSINIKKRWGDHRSYLKSGNHVNPHLQASYNKYGKEFFIYLLIEETSRKESLEREQWHLDNRVRWGFDYNIGTSALSGMKNRKHSDASKLKMSKSLSKENSPNWGKSHSAKTRNLISLSQNGEKNSMAKLSDDDAIKIFSLNSKGNYTNGELGEKFGVSHSTIGDLLRGISFRHLGLGIAPPKTNIKLNPKKVRKIRKLYATGDYTQVELGEMFGVDSTNIYAVVHRKTWKDVR